MNWYLISLIRCKIKTPYQVPWSKGTTIQLTKKSHIWLTILKRIFLRKSLSTKVATTAYWYKNGIKWNYLFFKSANLDPFLLKSSQHIWKTFQLEKVKRASPWNEKTWPGWTECDVTVSRHLGENVADVITTDHIFEQRVALLHRDRPTQEISFE